jgi:hypothetical protein
LKSRLKRRLSQQIIEALRAPLADRLKCKIPIHSNRGGLDFLVTFSTG